MLCIDSITIPTSNDQAQQFINVLCLRLTNNIINDFVSSFNNVVLLHSMFADCCMIYSWEWAPMVAIGQQQLPWSINVQTHLLKESSPPAFLPPILPPPPPCIIPQ
jgi:hypothetical protein